MDQFLLATGIECSYPTVESGKRRDQLEETGHYERWREDFELCREIGARVLRYGPPYYRMHLGPGEYDWSFTDEVLPVLRDLGITPILDLCHFGVPDWIGDFQNEDWPEYFAEYAKAFAERYQWIRLYTPVNEILVCARFSAKEGMWNEQLKSDKAMITSHAIQCKATLLAIEAIRKIRPDAVFIQSEACEVFLEQDPAQRERVEFLNELRFITFDFIYGRPPGATLMLFLQDQGLEQKQYDWFMEHGRAAAPHCVMGMDYYRGNEMAVTEDGSTRGIGPSLGWASIARQYASRYRKPIMLTETNVGHPDEGPKWLWDTWHNCAELRNDGFPVIGYTWYSLQNQVDWDIQLREIRGREVGNGLFDLDRKPNPVASEFQKLCKRYRDQPLLANFAMGSMPGGTSSSTEMHHAREKKSLLSIF